MSAARLTLLEERARLGELRSVMARRAYELGESTLEPALRAMQQHRAAVTERDLARLRQRRLTSELNEVRGWLP